MNDESSVVKPKSRLRKFAGILFKVVVIVFVLYSLARLVYRHSGSNQWELVYDKDGAKVYTLKQPGADLVLVRGVTRVRATLSEVVAWLTDPDTCEESLCKDARIIEEKEAQLTYSYLKFNMPGPFKPRDIAMRIDIHQFPRTKEIWAEYFAAPEKEPLHDCCVRITNMSNFWRVTPVGNGMVEMEYVMNMDWGGFIPDPLSNIGRPKFMLKNLKLMQGYVSREKYKTAKFDYIQEP